MHIYIHTSMRMCSTSQIVGSIIIQSTYKYTKSYKEFPYN